MTRRPLIKVLLVLVTLSSGFAMGGEKPPAPGEVREFEIATGAKMKFCWIPPGEAALRIPEIGKIESSKNA